MPRTRIFLTVAVSVGCIVQSGSARTQDGPEGVLFPDTATHAGNVDVMRWYHPNMTVVSLPDTLVFLYRPHNALPLDSLADAENLRGAVNGSFFDGVRGNASHAGWLSLYGKRVTPLMDDRQLTHIVRVSDSGRKIDCIPVHGFAPSADAGVLEFQTGPLVLDSGVVREDLIRASINGPSRHTRTLLATIDRTRLFFITVTDYVTLSELGAILKRLSVFQTGRLDVVNLDGGSSVALYLRNAAGFNFNAEDRLPIVVGFH